MNTTHSLASRAVPDEPSDSSPRVTRSLPVGRLMALLPLQLFLAAGWFRAGIEKLIDPDWWTGAHLVGFLAEQRDHMLPFFVPFADHVVEPLAFIIAGLVMSAQLAIADCLVRNRHVKPALWAGVVLNLCFTMAGRVNPSAFYLVMQVTLLFALARPVGPRVALRRAAGWLIPVACFAPFARTVHPAEVIDDPALMVSFVSLLAAVTTLAFVNQPSRLVEIAATSRIGRWVVERTGIGPQAIIRRFTRSE